MDDNARDKRGAADQIAALRKELSGAAAEQEQLRARNAQLDKSNGDLMQQVNAAASQRDQSSKEAQQWLTTVRSHTDALGVALAGHERLLRDCVSGMGMQTLFPCLISVCLLCMPSPLTGDRTWAESYNCEQ